MIEIVKELNIEVSKPNVFQAVVAKQYDMNTRFIKATFVDGKDKITIDPAATVKVVINALRPDGESRGFEGVVNEDGTVKVPLHSWMLELDGTVVCDISVIDIESDDNKKLTTTSFTLIVEKAAFGGDDITTDPQYDVLVQLLETCSNAGELAEEALEKSNAALEISTEAVSKAAESIAEAEKVAADANEAKTQAISSAERVDRIHQEIIQAGQIAEDFNVSTEAGDLVRPKAGVVIQSQTLPCDEFYVLPSDFENAFQIRDVYGLYYLKFSCVELWENSSMTNKVGTSLGLNTDSFYRITIYFDSLTDGYFGKNCLGLSSPLGVFDFTYKAIPVEYGENSITLEFETPDVFNDSPIDYDGDGVPDTQDESGWAFKFKDLSSPYPKITGVKIEETTSVPQFIFYTREETDKEIDKTIAKDSLVNVCVYKDNSPNWQDAPNDETSLYNFGIMTVIEGVKAEENSTIYFEVGWTAQYETSEAPHWGLVKKTTEGEIQTLLGMNKTIAQNGTCKGERIINTAINEDDVLYLTVSNVHFATFDTSQSKINISLVRNTGETVSLLSEKACETDTQIGNIESALDGIIAIQNNLIGGGSV